MASFRASRVCAIAILLIAGCGSGADDMSKERLASMAGGTLKPVSPVSGKVLVDGEPKAGVVLSLFASEGGPMIRECRTQADGTYCWTTHVSCDGLEPGEYRIAFKYVKPGRVDDDNAQVDLFKGRYSNPMKSEFKLSVASESPQKDVDYQLTMK